MAKRAYGQYCPIAESLDVVGERWTLLIIRELLGGPKRYTDLREALKGAWPNLLVERLRELEQAGLLEKVELPPPAARSVYELTEQGRALEPVLEELSRWGMKYLERPTKEQPAPDVAVWSSLVPYAEAGNAKPGSVWEVIVDGMPFALRCEHDRITFEAGTDRSPDLIVEADLTVLIDLRLGVTTLDAAKRTGRLQFSPDKAPLVAEFVAAFQLEQGVTERRAVS